MVASEMVDTKQLERREHQTINQAHQNNKAHKRGLYAPIGLPFPLSARGPLFSTATPSPYQSIKTALFTPD
jgi:hypothetical protein